MNEIKKKIVLLLEENNDKILYYNVFNMLTDFNNIKNFTSNKKGLYFDLDIIPDNTIKKIKNFIEMYISKKKLSNTIEQDRMQLVQKFKSEINTSYIKDLSDFINENEHSSSIIECNLDTKNQDNILHGQDNILHSQDNILHSQDVNIQKNISVKSKVIPDKISNKQKKAIEYSRYLDDKKKSPLMMKLKKISNLNKKRSSNRTKGTDGDYYKEDDPDYVDNLEDNSYYVEDEPVEDEDCVVEYIEDDVEDDIDSDIEDESIINSKIIKNIKNDDEYSDVDD